ncbi:hypothetical protein C8Q76DRAFT_252531 [Earliella scabrosa]|nr:hypothetical protein C8Q76DRAFT_252531 [Earliella scabrosa]
MPIVYTTLWLSLLPSWLTMARRGEHETRLAKTGTARSVTQCRGSLASAVQRKIMEIGLFAVPVGVLFHRHILSIHAQSIPLLNALVCLADQDTNKPNRHTPAHPARGSDRHRRARQYSGGPGYHIHSRLHFTIEGCVYGQGHPNGQYGVVPMPWLVALCWYPAARRAMG